MKSKFVFIIAVLISLFLTYNLEFHAGYRSVGRSGVLLGPDPSDSPQQTSAKAQFDPSTPGVTRSLAKLIDVAHASNKVDAA